MQILYRYIEIELDEGFIPSNTFADLNNGDIKKPFSLFKNGNFGSSNDCSTDELNNIESVINNVRQIPHPGFSVALYSVINAYNGVCSARTSPNVDTLACGFEDSVIKIWSMVPHWVHGIPSQITKNTTLLACDDDRFLDIPVKKEEDVDESSGSSRSRKQTSGGEIWSLRGHTGPVYDMEFTDDSNYLLSVSEDTYMRLWDVARGECVAKYSGHNYPVFRVCRSQKNVHIATGSYDLSARLWNYEYLHPIRVFAGHNASISSLAFHPNCSYLATGAWDHSIRLWQVTDANAARILLHHTAPVTSLAFAPNGK